MKKDILISKECEYVRGLVQKARRLKRMVCLVFSRNIRYSSSKRQTRPAERSRSDLFFCFQIST